MVNLLKGLGSAAFYNIYDLEVNNNDNMCDHYMPLNKKLLKFADRNHLKNQCNQFQFCPFFYNKIRAHFNLQFFFLRFVQPFKLNKRAII